MENELNPVWSKDELLVIRGRITNKNCISIPEEYHSILEENTITISVTPIGSHQNIIIKRITGYEIYLQSNGGLPIDCFYHIFAKKSPNKDEES
jgi:hypothetical protein